MTSFWCELAWLGGARAQPGVVVGLDGPRIASVSPGVSAPPAGVTRLEGLTLPGLANAHSHAFQRVLRGRTHLGGGSFWTWREQMYAAAERLDPDSYFALARATFAEMVLAGVSCVGEFHYLHHGPGGVPYEDPNAMGRALIAAAAEAGLRITLIDACYLHGGFGEPPAERQRRFCDPSAAAWTERTAGLADADGVRIGAAIHSVRAVDPDSSRTVAEVADTRGLPLHAHLSEQPAENEGCMAAHGLTPTGVLADAGALGERFTAIHATHLTPADTALLGSADVTCCVCPTTERDLADGIGRMSELAAAGARLSVGSDSHATIDLFEEARAIELDERLATGQRGLHEPAALLRAATEQGHASLGWADAGRLEAGARADLVTLDLGGVRLAGSPPDEAVAAAVFAATAADVRHVVIDGRPVVRDGHHTELDVADELRQAIAAVSV